MYTLTRLSKWHNLPLLIISVVIGVICGFLVVILSATSYSASLQLSSASVSNGASIVTNSQAIGGKLLIFSTPSTIASTPIPTPATTQSPTPKSISTPTLKSTSTPKSTADQKTGTTTSPVLKPTATLSVSPTSITSGQDATLTWSSTNTTSCIASGAWSGTITTSGSQSTGVLTQNSTYNISCSGSGGTANASATVTVTAPGYSCITSATNGHCPFPSDSYIIGANSNPYVDQNVWSGNGSYQQTLYANSPEDWYITANADTDFGGVLTYPNTGFDMTGTVDGFSSITSSWNVTIPTNTATTAGWAAYDLWFNNWADEVMIQTDITANSYYDCTAVATAIFSGMPWHLCVFGSERVWKPGTDDSHLINQASGSVDVRSILVWMEQNGYLPTSSTWTAGSFGFEVCDTEGNTQIFQVNDFSWDAE